MTERESFEYFCNARLISHARKGDGYLSAYTDDMWCGWQARAELSSSTRTQGADEQPENILGPDEDGLPVARYSYQTGIGMVEHRNGTYIRYGEIEQRLRSFKGADDAQPVAIYQVRYFGAWGWHDAEEEGYKLALANEDMRTRIVYATRDAAPIDAKDAQRYRDIRAISVAEMTWPSDAEFDAYIDETIASAPEKPAGDVSDI